MLKYAITDIQDGVNYLKIGVSNIVTSLIKGDIKEFIIPFSINYLIILGILKSLYTDINEDNNLIICKVDNTIINIDISNNIRFYT